LGNIKSIQKAQKRAKAEKDSEKELSPTKSV
jgi:hypothetical protein